jgi:hypothetical protein
MSGLSHTQTADICDGAYLCFDIQKVSLHLFLFLLNNTSKKTYKIKGREYFFIIAFFYATKFTSENDEASDIICCGSRSEA